eukprot:g14839.t1
MRQAQEQEEAKHRHPGHVPKSAIPPLHGIMSRQSNFSLMQKDILQTTKLVFDTVLALLKQEKEEGLAELKELEPGMLDLEDAPGFYTQVNHHMSGQLESLKPGDSLVDDMQARLTVVVGALKSTTAALGEIGVLLCDVRQHSISELEPSWLKFLELRPPDSLGDVKPRKTAMERRRSCFILIAVLLATYLAPSFVGNARSENVTKVALRAEGKKRLTLQEEAAEKEARQKYRPGTYVPEELKDKDYADNPLIFFAPLAAWAIVSTGLWVNANILNPPKDNFSLLPKELRQPAQS